MLTEMYPEQLGRPLFKQTTVHSVGPSEHFNRLFELQDRFITLQIITSKQKVNKLIINLLTILYNYMSPVKHYFVLTDIF